MPAHAAGEAGTATIRRGDVWWVDLNPTLGSEIRKSRPAVIISADGLNRARRTVVVIPLSTGPAARPPLVVPTPSLGEASMAVCDQLRAVDKSRLTRPAGVLSGADLRAVENGLRSVLKL